ncbi:hypothetical protein TNCV_4694121 [Trichonephila clavipes]|uniref:Uncharacterized protein n=1 Tax=Trichonephila clavipes TaxID=2585209 RepID=A0A8X6WAT1_TRICX|nr:hypothetical protein TNCV_4694121 [Trichonephila clavipes]
MERRGLQSRQNCSRVDIRSQSSSVDEARFGESGEYVLKQVHFEEVVKYISWCYGCSSCRSNCRRLDEVHEPKSPQEIVHQKRTGIDVLPFKS